MCSSLTDRLFTNLCTFILASQWLLRVTNPEVFAIWITMEWKSTVKCLVHMLHSINKAEDLCSCLGVCLTAVFFFFSKTILTALLAHWCCCCVHPSTSLHRIISFIIPSAFQCQQGHEPPQPPVSTPWEDLSCWCSRQHPSIMKYPCWNWVP